MATSNNNLRPASIMSKDLAKSARKGGKANSYNITVGGSGSSNLTDKLIICRCVFLSNIDLDGAETTDGITVANGEIVLVNGQTDKTENGVYLVATGGAWVRSGTLYSGMLISIKEGTNYKDTLWVLESPNNDPVIGTDDIDFLQIDAKKISLPLSVANGGTGASTASTARSNLGLGTMAVQNANNVNITGGQIVITAGSNSGISIGASGSFSITSVGSATSSIVRNDTNTAYNRFVSGERFDWLSNSGSNSPYYFELNSATNTQPFAQYIRNRTNGSTTTFDRKNVNSTNVLSTSDSILDVWRITPTSGVNAENSIAHRVITASTAVPDTAMDFITTNDGASVNNLRIGGGVNGFYFGNNVTNSSNRIGLFYNDSSGYNLIFPSAQGASNTYLKNDGSGNLSWDTVSGGSGTVTSVAISGGTTGLTVSGSPITTSGTITLGGALVVAHGGTGSATAEGARTNLGLDIGIDVQAYSDLVQEIADLSGDGVLVKNSTNITTNSAIKSVIAKYKTASETVTNSTTLQDDDDFVFAVEANKTYQISGMWRLSANSSGGFKWGFTLPSGTTGRMTIRSTQVHSDTDITAGLGSTATFNASDPTLIYGYLTTSSTAGNVVFRWAQNASALAGTILFRTSIMTLTEV